MKNDNITKKFRDMAVHVFEKNNIKCREQNDLTFIGKVEKGGISYCTILGFHLPSNHISVSVLGENGYLSKRIDYAVAVNEINKVEKYVTFKYDISIVGYRCTVSHCYEDNEFGEETIVEMLNAVMLAYEKYYKVFEDISNGNLTIMEFINQLHKGGSDEW